MDAQPETRQRVFDTPLSVQRYQWVKDYLIGQPHLKSVTDFGCGNGRILNWLKHVPTVERINFVDSDIGLLENEINYNFQPNFCEMLNGRDSSVEDLEVKVFHANVSIPDDRLRADCITMVEVIEHMHPEEVERATRAVFGYYQPQSVIITTPNSEFNCLLQNGPRPTKFRHYDHKFEWTREEFRQFVEGVTSQYQYSCQLDGVGHLPNLSEPYGPCTQIAVFTRSADSQGAANSVEKDLHCFDLLLNKLSVRENVPEWQYDPAQKKVSLLTEYTIPGSTNTERINSASIPFDWGTNTMDVN